MDKIRCKILPPKIERFNQEDLNDYLKRLYTCFENDFITKKTYFNNKEIIFRKEPYSHGNYEEAFIHITHKKHNYKKNIKDRTIDYSRSAKIPWIKAILENIPCPHTCCEGIKMWIENNRIHILLEKFNYIIVLEERKKYYLLITAYFLQTKYELDEKIKRYNNNPKYYI